MIERLLVQMLEQFCNEYLPQAGRSGCGYPAGQQSGRPVPSILEAVCLCLGTVKLNLEDVEFCLPAAPEPDLAGSRLPCDRPFGGNNKF